MRKRIVAGNWKMNKNYLEGVALINEINRKLHDISGYLNPTLHEVVVAPPFTLLHKAATETGNPLSNSFAAL
ncbi:MAG: triose-phosphate isomerase, partial [Bacteroidales bacterium]|nr:triose-phosphate isomerase [Bacteroidales bacterium]